MTQSPHTEPHKPENPIDVTVRDLIDEARKDQRGFVLGVLSGEDGTKKIEVVKSLEPMDTRKRPAALRVPTINSTDSLIDYAKRYGDELQSVVFYDEDQVTCVLDYDIDKGERESATMQFTPHEDLVDWLVHISRPMGHKTLVLFMREYEHNLVDPDMIHAIRSMTLSGTIDHESDLDDDGNTLGFKFKTKAGPEIKKFPKRFGIELPVLDIDAEPTFKAECRLEIELPTDPKDTAKFTIRCPQLKLAMRERAMREGELIRDGLKNWAVICGRDEYQQQSVGTRK